MYFVVQYDTFSKKGGRALKSCICNAFIGQNDYIRSVTLTERKEIFLCFVQEISNIEH
jgi:hypothetical protein